MVLLTRLATDEVTDETANILPNLSRSTHLERRDMRGRCPGEFLRIFKSAQFKNQEIIAISKQRHLGIDLKAWIKVGWNVFLVIPEKK